jgi:RNA polymerase sigma-70 factor (ECF subfamily)
MNNTQYKKEFSRLRPKLLNIARKILNDDEEAEDAVQDALLRIWQLHEQLKPPIDSFAFILLRNICISTLRRRPSTTAIEDIQLEMTMEEDEKQRMEQTMLIVENLPDKQQTILRLRHMEGMEMSEIASLLCTTEAAIRKSLSRARQQVREMFKKRIDLD